MSDAAEAMTVSQLRHRLSHQCEMAGGQSEWARQKGVSPSVVSDVLRGKRDPSTSVLNAMGLMRVERFIPVRRGSNG